ncbi:MAG: peptidoglycan DD-metalloendopeptidase family protein, partial [Anaerolineae bacterium]|nr:peptidoglycan DD-metalloendopeptidase family protein [Anaerolineae bacterium]
MTDSSISHALVLPDRDFNNWLQVVRPYTDAFERVAIVRSPAGNDLNRYRNVSAVTAPLTWYQDDPLRHIRRVYPMVVRVDLVQAKTPQQLSGLLANRIAKADRYGERTGEASHLYDRFVLDWPTVHRPIEIVTPFYTNNNPMPPGLGIRSAPGAMVTAAANGTVTRQWGASTSDSLGLGQYVQVTTIHQGQTFIVTYAGLRKISVPLNTQVKLGDALGEAADEQFHVIVQQLGNGMSGYKLPDIIDPTSLVYVQDLRVRPIDTGLRVRTLPTTDG